MEICINFARTVCHHSQFQDRQSGNSKIVIEFNRNNDDDAAASDATDAVPYQTIFNFIKQSITFQSSILNSADKGKFLDEAPTKIFLAALLIYQFCETVSQFDKSRRVTFALNTALSPDEIFRRSKPRRTSFASVLPPRLIYYG